MGVGDYISGDVDMLVQTDHEVPQEQKLERKPSDEAEQQQYQLAHADENRCTYETGKSFTDSNYMDMKDDDAESSESYTESDDVNMMKDEDAKASESYTDADDLNKKDEDAKASKSYTDSNDIDMKDEDAESSESYSESDDVNTMKDEDAESSESCTESDDVNTNDEGVKAFDDEDEPAQSVDSECCSSSATTLHPPPLSGSSAPKGARVRSSGCLTGQMSLNTQCLLPATDVGARAARSMRR